MTKNRKIGLVIIISGIAMLLFGASMFSYQGNLNPIVSGIGMFSFLFWLPTVIVGIVFMATKKSKT